MGVPLNPASAAVMASFRKSAVSATSFFLLVDLDNAGGLYKHASGSGMKLIGANGTLIKDKILDQWLSQMGVVTAVDAPNNQATIAYTRLGAVGLRDTVRIQDVFSSVPYPALADFTVSGGQPTKLATNHSVVETVTGAQAEDIGGQNRVLAPGDLVLKVQKVLGTGTVIANYTIWYFVE